MLNRLKRICDICDDCQEQCFATLYCEICIRNYLKAKFLAENDDTPRLG